MKLEFLRWALLGSCIPLLALARVAHSQESPEPVEAEAVPLVRLEEVLDRIAPRLNKEFLISRASQNVDLGGAEVENITYPLLLSILRNNGLAAVEIEGRVNIIPEPFVRAYPVPMAQRDSDDIPDDEWVTRVIEVRNIEAAQIVPVLRPLMPQAAHLAAMLPNKLIIVDRYANVRRITEIVNTLDR